MNEKDFEMRDEYDFSTGERGKFYFPDATYSFPIYLDHDVLKHFADMARVRGVETRIVIGEILRRQMPAPPVAASSERR